MKDSNAKLVAKRLLKNPQAPPLRSALRSLFIKGSRRYHTFVMMDQLSATENLMPVYAAKLQ